MKQSEIINDFIYHLNLLSDKEKISLRREYNTNYTDADVYSLISFFKCLSSSVSNDRHYIYYFCACLHINQEYNNSNLINLELSEIIYRLKCSGEDTMLKRFHRVLAEDLTEDSLFLYKLGQLIKLCNNYGYKVSIIPLLSDLLSLSFDNDVVKKKWVMNIYKIKNNNNLLEESK